jgi:hypothetical protein
MKVIHFSAKCSDLFNATLTDGAKPVRVYDGYVPDFFPGEHFGDYVELKIDVDTGKILNWKKPTAEDLEIFKPE